MNRVASRPRRRHSSPRATRMRSSARPYVAGALILWAVALQAHVWSIPDAELRRLRGDSRVSFVPSARGVHARGARRDGDDDDDASARRRD